MELEIRNEEVKCDHNQTLPGWSKTGRRTRATRLHPPPERPLGYDETASRDEARDLSDDLECGELARENLPPKKRKLGSVTMNDGKEGERKQQQQQHKCNICSRSFSSYQALGGHKAHHSTKDAAHDQPPKGGGAAAVHRCTFCYKVFSKGQALGGHRRHCQRPAESENKAKIFSFDLNEHPPEWLGS